MRIRTYFWHSRIISPFWMKCRRLVDFNPSRYFLTGNAGDLFCRHLILDHYRLDCLNIKDEGRRLLLIGSIASVIKDGDVLCGIGVKSSDQIKQNPRVDCHILGLRGPISYEIFKKSGYDLSEVKFLLDPGLLIKNLIPRDILNTQPNEIVFIPHYRERFVEIKKLPRNFKFVDIDSEIVDLANQILGAKLVYSSSLHGIIFAHALGRPCVFVKPQTDEPLLKFEDYYESIGLKMPKPLDSIGSYNFHLDSDFVPSLDLSNLQLPPMELLKSLGITDQGSS